MKKKIISLALCLLMLLPLTLMSCKPDEEPDPITIPTETLLSNIELSDLKLKAPTLKEFSFDTDSQFQTVGKSFVASMKPIFDTEDTSKRVGTEYKLQNVNNDTAVTITSNDIITSDDEGYDSAITGVELQDYNENFMLVAVAYGDRTRMDARLYNEFGVLVAELKGVSTDKAQDYFDLDSELNSQLEYYHDSLGDNHIYFMKKLYLINDDDLTLTEVIDLSTANFDLDTIVYSAELGGYISYDGNNITTSLAVFNKNLELQFANEFIPSPNSEEAYCLFVAPCVAVYTELILLPDDAQTYDVIFDTSKCDVKITRFDFATGASTDIPFNGIIFTENNRYYESAELNESLEKQAGFKLKEQMLVSSYETVENGFATAHNDVAVIDENLNVIKYLELPLSDSQCIPLQLPNGELVIYTRFGFIHVNADGTLGAIISMRNCAWNNLWKIVENEKIYDSTNTLIYTVPETRELVHVLDNSVILREEAKAEDGSLLGYNYVLWKGVGNETKLGDTPISTNDPTQMPTEGTYSELNQELLSNGYYAINTVNWADIAAGKQIYSITFYDSLGNQLAKYDNVTDYDYDYSSEYSTGVLTLEITTYDAENNPTVSRKLVMFVDNNDSFAFGIGPIL